MGTSLGTDTANMKTLDTYKSSLHKSREEKWRGGEQAQKQEPVVHAGFSLL